MKHWSPREIAQLNRLRERFITGTAGQADYWSSPEELALYDATFGERIGWKWDAVLRELRVRGWAPQADTVLDWGCGSGIAGRRVLAQWPEQLKALSLHDRSSLALRYAAERARADFPKVQVGTTGCLGALLIVSHVINELRPAALEELLARVSEASELLWVEAGTHADSRALIGVRERLLAEGWNAVAPCTHQAGCGLLKPDNARHWCHYFAPPPPEAFQNARWAELGKEIGIDLRSLPYSFLVLTRRPAPVLPGSARILGEPREFKGYLKVLTCQASGVDEPMLQKRDDPALFKTVRKGHEPPLYRWTRDPAKITGGEPIFSSE